MVQWESFTKKVGGFNKERDCFTAKDGGSCMTGRKGEGAFCQEGLWVVKEIRKKKKTAHSLLGSFTAGCRWRSSPRRR